MRQFECTLKHFIVPNKVQLTNKGGNLINNIKEAANICSFFLTQNKYTVCIHVSVYHVIPLPVYSYPRIRGPTELL